MNRTIRTLQNKFALSVASHDSPETARLQLEAYKLQPSLAKRLSCRAVHACAGLSPSLARETFLYPYERVGLKGLGIGHDSTVVTDGSEVIKIHRGSRDLGRNGKRELAGRLRELISANMLAHPEQTAPTDVRLMADPLNKGGQIVGLTQELYEADATEPPDAELQVADFASVSLKNMYPRGYLPDMVGANNIMFVDGKLKLIDTVAVSDMYPLSFKGQEQAVRQLANRAHDLSKTASSINR